MIDHRRGRSIVPQLGENESTAKSVGLGKLLVTPASRIASGTRGGINLLLRASGIICVVVECHSIASLRTSFIQIDELVAHLN